MNLNGNRLRSAAPKLYRAARLALNILMQDDGIAERVKGPAVVALREALDAAEEGSPASSITFITTHATAEQIMRFATAKNNGPDEAKQLLRALRKGRRDTKQRVYFQLGIDIDILRSLRELLDNGEPSGGSRRAFDRIAEQIDREVLSKSPLKLLADAGA